MRWMTAIIPYRGGHWVTVTASIALIPGPVQPLGVTEPHPSQGTELS